MKERAENVFMDFRGKKTEKESNKEKKRLTRCPLMTGAFTVPLSKREEKSSVKKKRK